MNMHAGARGSRVHSQATLFVEFRPSMRALLEDAIESLVLFLDEMDVDADAEPADEEAP